MPAAAAIASPASMRTAAFAISLVCACSVLGYSLYKAHRGDWVHIDASFPVERAQLNARVGIGLLVGAAALWLAGVHMGVSSVVGLSGLIVAVGHLFRRIAKLSLHVAFAVFAAFLVWPDPIAAVSLSLTAAAVAWSRLALRRHARVDIVLGALAGAAAGLVFHILAALDV
jgi:TRAP-type uncharacterized transport system fused permease subunit